MGPTKLVAVAMSLAEAKMHNRLFIYSRSFTSPENSVKIGWVDVEIIGMAEIIKEQINK